MGQTRRVAQSGPMSHCQCSPVTHHKNKGGPRNQLPETLLESDHAAESNRQDTDNPDDPDYTEIDRSQRTLGRREENKKRHNASEGRPRANLCPTIAGKEKGRATQSQPNVRIDDKDQIAIE